MKARSFFYVCCGLFLLALSYHLGARNAGAQSGSSRWVGGNYFVAGGQLWKCTPYSGWQLAYDCTTAPLPLPTDVIAGAWGDCHSDPGSGIVSFAGDAWVYV